MMVLMLGSLAVVGKEKDTDFTRKNDPWASNAYMGPVVCP